MPLNLRAECRRASGRREKDDGKRVIGERPLTRPALIHRAPDTRATRLRNGTRPDKARLIRTRRRFSSSRSQCLIKLARPRHPALSLSRSLISFQYTCKAGVTHGDALYATRGSMASRRHRRPSRAMSSCLLCRVMNFRAPLILIPPVPPLSGRD